MAKLREHGTWLHCVYEDEQGQPAFTINFNTAEVNGISIVKREKRWSQFHPLAGRGPEMAFLHWGPMQSPGHLYIGNVSYSQPMKEFLVVGKKQNSVSRYFDSREGRRYKWKANGNTLELLDKRKNQIALWNPNDRDLNGRPLLTISEAGLHMSTEIIMTLLLNKVSKDQSWPV